ncbi:MAG: thioredoxin-disulfide reductase [Chloroflexi bacterium RBG_13_54_8]|nr:MAG: thioredoxin-disulfide reductase [Chloroflexi bacterium RBG_13_54_8]
MTEYEVIIIGGGPAGLTAGLYTSRAGLKSLLIERGLFGGQMVNARLVENYPGFPEGISGFDLGQVMHQQALRYGLQTTTEEVASITPGQPHRVSVTDGDLATGAVIIATGSENQKLDAPGEEKLVGRGVSYCATCDGFLFRDQKVAVIGGGDTAVTDAIELSQLAQKVYVIHRRAQLRAGQVLQQRAFAAPRIQFLWNTVVDEVVGDEGKVSALKLRNVKTQQTSSLDIDGVFVAIGLKPNSQRFVGLVQLAETGHIITNELMTTSVPGVFVAGDVRSNSARQISTAVGDGATAAMSALRYLRQ